MVNVDVLNLTIRVRTRARAPMREIEQRKAPPEQDRRVYLTAPPIAGTIGEAPAPSQEEDTASVESVLESVDLGGLSDRVYEMMRYDVRVGRERGGGV